MPTASFPLNVRPISTSNTYLPPGKIGKIHSTMVWHINTKVPFILFSLTGPTATVYQVGTTPSLDSSTVPTPSTSDSETIANELSPQTASTRLPTTVRVNRISTQKKTKI